MISRPLGSFKIATAHCTLASERTSFAPFHEARKVSSEKQIRPFRYNLGKCQPVDFASHYLHLHLLQQRIYMYSTFKRRFVFAEDCKGHNKETV